MLLPRVGWGSPGSGLLFLLAPSLFYEELRCCNFFGTSVFLLLFCYFLFGVGLGVQAIFLTQQGK